MIHKCAVSCRLGCILLLELSTGLREISLSKWSEKTNTRPNCESARELYLVLSTRRMPEWEHSEISRISVDTSKVHNIENSELCDKVFSPCNVCQEAASSYSAPLLLSHHHITTVTTAHFVFALHCIAISLYIKYTPVFAAHSATHSHTIFAHNRPLKDTS